MKLRRTTIAIASLLIIAGCGTSNSDNDNNKNLKDGGDTLFGQVFDKNTANGNSVRGVWEASVPSNSFDGTRETYRLEIRDGFVTMAVRCLFNDGIMLYSQVSSPANLRRKRLIVRQPNQRTESVGRYDCTARIMRLNNQTSQPYILDFGRLIVKVNEVGPLTYSKIGN